MKKVITYSLLALLALSLPACESLVEGLNKDPNNPTDASAELMLTGAELANITIHEGHTARLSGLWSGYFTGVDRQYKDLYTYNANGATFDQIWQNVYYGVLEQTNQIIAKSEQVNNRLVIGIAKVLQAHAIGTAAACWGDVPYREAAQIRDFPNPTFDPQAQVYADVQALLSEALEELTSGIGTSPGVADIHFGGDAAKWAEVAHTLKARFYLHTRAFDLAYQESLQGVSVPANSMMAPHGNTVGANENMYYTFVARSRAGDMNSEGAYVTTLLNPDHANYRGDAKTDESARFNYNFMNLGALSVTDGLVPNYRPIAATDSMRGFIAQSAAFPLVTYQENLLTQAEAGARSMDFATGLAALNEYRAYLNAGGYLDASYQQHYPLRYDAYAEADFAAGGMANPDGLSAADALLDEILEERYVSFIGQKLGFYDLRRTQKETVGIKLTPVTGSVIPQRMIYSQSEINSNTSAPSPVPDLFVPTPLNQ
ncbi:SusD family protein [Catalinimonas alkaloidigena]|uniref:SusD family protein n=1 Tax=Catalinimonas alkaloidigena TaxID=1075417 RepID=A0A1G8YGB2_9BACT|nr:SusD/RagB family nutrient-binding outer membrane lipoprotein [Catalinimonas alkaloidigena]SDK01733.1 SusD family protein [Catalinimonas alkaloidigena]